MGKNKIKNPSVSIITITQFERNELLNILIDNIKDQDYTYIIEWVIVEGSKTIQDKMHNSLKIKELKEKSKLNFPIIYIESDKSEEIMKLGNLRNIGNNSCKGDITVVMDDDDFYPKTRVSHSVNKLINSEFKIAGCSAFMMYDYILDKLYKFKEFGSYHSTNNCMAWKKEYILTHNHDPNKDIAEESEFTNNFTEPMVQLNPDDTIIGSSHMYNTFNKREFCTAATIKIHPKLEELNIPLTNFMSLEKYNKYKNIFVKSSDSIYDIVYFCGGFSIKWNPSDMKLGGSEQAIVHLCNNWVKLGKKVAVYGEVSDKNYNGVDYIDWRKFPFEQNFKTIILWRLFGLISGIPFNIKAKKVILDLHDNILPKIIENYKNFGQKIDNIFLKSNYHKEIFLKAFDNKFDHSKIKIIPNGIRINEFRENKYNEVRNQYRFCYCSCYTRGIQNILEKIWPVIYKYEPRAELHVYYGMEGVQDQNFKNNMTLLLAQPGVMDHGRQPMEMIIREKYLSNFQLYITETTAEIDCISIKESLVTGCIPLISNFGVFKERDGIHFDIDDEKSYKLISVKIIQLLKKFDEMNKEREKLKLSSSLLSWEEISQKWLDLI